MSPSAPLDLDRALLHELMRAWHTFNAKDFGHSV